MRNVNGKTSLCRSKVLSTCSLEQSVPLSYNEKRWGKARRDGKRCVITRPVLLRSPHSTSGIGSVKWYGTPLHLSSAFAVENGLRWGRKQRESIARVWLI